MADSHTEIKVVDAQPLTPHEPLPKRPVRRIFDHIFDGLDELNTYLTFNQRMQFYCSYLAILVCGFAILLAFSATIILAFYSGIWAEITRLHFAAIVGLPSAAAASLFLVLVLSTATGSIEFEALGFKFRGAAGPLVFWIACFLSITLAIKLLW
jgi:hypothetical protein